MDDKGKAVDSNGNSYARELKEMPDHSNEITRATELKLGPFLFDQIESPRPFPIVDRGPYELDNGAIYYSDNGMKYYLKSLLEQKTKPKNKTLQLEDWSRKELTLRLVGEVLSL